jgi:hypothetical protein
MHLFDLPASWQVSKYLKTSIKTYYNMNNKDRYIWKTRRRRRRILSNDAKDIKCIKEFMYQGLENSIQLELGTLQQDVMRSRASSLSTILTSSNIRRDDDDDDYDDVIGRDKHNNKRINENTVLTYISSSKTLLSFYCIDVKYDIVKIVLYV